MIRLRPVLRIEGMKGHGPSDAWRLGAIGGVIALGSVLVAGPAPAWSVSACPARLVAPSALAAAAGGGCAEEWAEEELEEKLEQREDEEEEQAIAGERAALLAKVAAEEAAEEAAEQGPGVTAGPGHSIAGKGKGRGGGKGRGVGMGSGLTLRVGVLVIRRNSRRHPAETRIAVSSSVPARIDVVLEAAGRPTKRRHGESDRAREFLARVPWACATQAHSYRYTVTAIADAGDGARGAGATVRRGVFTVDRSGICRGR